MACMRLQLNDLVMLPGCHPYPRYGHVAAIEDAEQVRVTRITCGDPRCAAEHQHGDMIWPAADLEAIMAYQPRARWEAGPRSLAEVSISS